MSALSERIHGFAKHKCITRITGIGLQSKPESTYNGCLFDVVEQNAWVGTGTIIYTNNNVKGKTVLATNHHVMGGSGGAPFHKMFTTIEGKNVQVTPIAWNSVEPMMGDKGLPFRVSDVALCTIDNAEMHEAMSSAKGKSFKSPFTPLLVGAHNEAAEYWAMGFANGTIQPCVSKGNFSCMEHMVQMGGYKKSAPIMTQFTMSTTHGNSGGPVCHFVDNDPSKLMASGLVAWGFSQDPGRSYAVPYFAVENLIRQTGGAISSNGLVDYKTTPKSIGTTSVRRALVAWNDRSSLDITALAGTWTGRVDHDCGIKTPHILKKIGDEAVESQLDAMIKIQSADSSVPLSIELESHDGGHEKRIVLPVANEIAVLEQCRFMGMTFRGHDRPSSSAMIELQVPHRGWLPVISAEISPVSRHPDTRVGKIAGTPFDARNMSINQFMKRCVGDLANANGSKMCVKMNNVKIRPSIDLSSELHEQMIMGTLAKLGKISGTNFSISIV
jgi:hypothetical protein